MTARLKGRLPPHLVACPGCRRHLYPQAKSCPHCGGVLTVLRRRQLANLKKAQQAVDTLRRLFGSADP